MQEIQFDYFHGMEAEQYTFLPDSENFYLPQNASKLFPAKQRFYTVCCWTV